jgi:predicted nucleic acid-binding protein
LLFLIDTNAFSDLMAEQPRVAAKLAALPQVDRVCITTTVRGEILYGISRLPAGKRRDSLQARAQVIFGSVPCEPLTSRAADHYAFIKQKMASQGMSIAENDLWIASSAMELGAVVVTRDRAFWRISGLAVEDWTA